MNKIFSLLIILLFFNCLHAQIKPFRFIHISDTHIGSPDGKAEEDLRRTVNDINQMKDVDFVVITGDITELGTDVQLKTAKQILDSLLIKYYIIPGNHDDGWSESGGLSFITTFGNDKFVFDHNGIRFMGCASGPYVRMSDGHVPRGAIVWLDEVLKKTSKDQPIIFLNHYPLDNQLDNWYEIIDRLKQYNTIAVLCGHGHANKLLNFEGIPGVMGRSNLRAKAPVGGYNIVDVRNDSIIYSERKPGIETFPFWTSVKIEKHHNSADKNFTRPDYSINEKYPQVKELWRYSSDANIISTPAVMNDLVMVGNQKGEFVALSLKNGSKVWSYTTGGPIFSSPAVSNKFVVFGSTDHFVYCLSSSGKIISKLKTDGPVLGSPVINHDTIYIAGSDHCMQAILPTGKSVWRNCILSGPMVSTPVIYNNELIFGAWDKNLYALSKTDGKFLWKWNSGSSIINYSPAACIPVVHDDVVYVVAPDRYISAIDAHDGKTLWRNNEATVRESIGISSGGKFVYGKTMQDTIVAYATGRETQHPAWKMNCGFGYEHVPSMLIEKDGEVFFGTRNGVVYCIDPVQQKIIWVHKIDNSMVNTVRVINNKNVIASTMDGKVVLLRVN